MAGRAKSTRSPGSPQEVYGTLRVPGDGVVHNRRVLHSHGPRSPGRGPPGGGFGHAADTHDHGLPRDTEACTGTGADRGTGTGAGAGTSSGTGSGTGTGARGGPPRSLIPGARPPGARPSGARPSDARRPGSGRGVGAHPGRSAGRGARPDRHRHRLQDRLRLQDLAPGGPAGGRTGLGAARRSVRARSPGCRPRRTARHPGPGGRCRTRRVRGPGGGAWGPHRGAGGERRTAAAHHVRIRALPGTRR